MPSFRSVLAVVFPLVLAAPAAFAQDCPAVVWKDSFETSKGKTLALPEIGTLTCDEIEGTLSSIDATRYRENTPRPTNSADTPLYCYERKLAQVHYQVCVVQRQSALDTGEALRQQAE